MRGRAVLLFKGSFSRHLLSPSPQNPRFLSPFPSSIIGRFFSSEGDSSRRSPFPLRANPIATHSAEDDASSDVNDISREELKKRIDKYFEGDVEALPSIFEAILERKLSGKHENSDDELMDELRSKSPHSVELEEDDDNLTSDDDFYETDEDSDDS